MQFLMISYKEFGPNVLKLFENFVSKRIIEFLPSLMYLQLKIHLIVNIGESMTNMVS